MNRKGFAVIPIIIGALFVLALATSVYFYLKHKLFYSSPKIVTNYHVMSSPEQSNSISAPPVKRLSGKVFYLSGLFTSSRDTILLDFDRGIKIKTGIPYVYRGDNNQFLLISPDKTKIALLGEGTSTFEVTPFQISDLFIKNALACMAPPVATLYVIDLEKKTKIKLADSILFNDYATSSSVQWVDNNSICYQEYRHKDSSRCSGIVPGKTWQISLDGSKTEIASSQCRPQPQDSSVAGWNTLAVNENETLIKTDDGIYPLGNRWESTSIVLKNSQNNQRKTLVAKGSQLVTSEIITLAPLKNAFLFETVKQGKTKMEKDGNEEVEIMSLGGEVLLRTAGTYATWIP